MRANRFLISTVTIVGLLGGAAGINHHRQKAAWPSLENTAPLVQTPAQSVSPSWDALSEAAAAVVASEATLTILHADNPPELAAWEPINAHLDALPQILEQSPLITPLGEMSGGMWTALSPTRKLHHVLIERGWAHYRDGAVLDAAADMLLADQLGQQLCNGHQASATVIIGLSMQTSAMTSLAELLSLVDEEAVYALAASRLPVQAPDPARLDEAHLYRTQEMANFAQDNWQTVDESGAFSDRMQQRRLVDDDATLAQLRSWGHAHQAWLSLPPHSRGESPAVLPDGVSLYGTYNTGGIRIMRSLSSIASLGNQDDRHLSALQRDMLLVQVARHQYAAEQDGQQPHNIAELVPGYLPAVPTNPFTGEALTLQDDLTATLDILSQS